MEAWEPIILAIITVGSLFVVFLLGYRGGWADRGRMQSKVEREVWNTQRRNAHRDQQRLQLDDDLEREMSAIEPAPENRRRRL